MADNTEHEPAKQPAHIVGSTSTGEPITLDYLLNKYAYDKASLAEQEASDVVTLAAYTVDGHPYRASVVVSPHGVPKYAGMELPPNCPPHLVADLLNAVKAIVMHYET